MKCRTLLLLALAYSSRVQAAPLWKPGNVALRCSDFSWTPLEIVDSASGLLPKVLDERSGWPVGKAALYSDFESQLVGFTIALHDAEASAEVDPGDYDLGVPEGMTMPSGCEARFLSKIFYVDETSHHPKIFYNRTLLRQLRPEVEAFAELRAFGSLISDRADDLGIVFQSLFLGHPSPNRKYYRCDSRLSCEWANTLESIGMGTVERFGYPWAIRTDAPRYAYVEGFPMALWPESTVNCRDLDTTSRQAFSDGCAIHFVGKPLRPGEVLPSFEGVFESWQVPGQLSIRSEGGAGELVYESNTPIILKSPYLGISKWSAKRVSWDKDRRITGMDAALNRPITVDLGPSRTVKISPSDENVPTNLKFTTSETGTSEWEVEKGPVDLEFGKFKVRNARAVELSADTSRKLKMHVAAGGNTRADFREYFSTSALARSDCGSLISFEFSGNDFEKPDALEIGCKGTVSLVQSKYLQQYTGKWNYEAGPSDSSSKVYLGDAVKFEPPGNFKWPGALDGSGFDLTLSDFDDQGSIAGRCGMYGTGEERRRIEVFGVSRILDCIHWALPRRNPEVLSVELGVTSGSPNPSFHVPGIKATDFTFDPREGIDIELLGSGETSRVSFVASIDRRTTFRCPNGSSRSVDPRKEEPPIHFTYSADLGLRLATCP